MNSLDIILKRKTQIIVVFAVLFSAATVRVFLFPLYETDTTIMVDLKEHPTSVDSANIDMAEMVGLVRKHMNLLLSAPVVRSVVEELKLYKNPSTKSDIEKVNDKAADLAREKKIRKVTELVQKKYISLNSPPFTNLIEIKVKYKNAEKAAQIANTLVKNYASWSINFTHSEVDNVLVYLNKEVDSARDRLLKSEEEVKKFREENKVIDLSEEIKAQLQIVPEEIKSHYKIIQQMEIKLFEMEVELSRLRELYTDNSQQVEYMKKRISYFNEKLNEENKKSKYTEDYLDKMRGMPEKEIALARLMRNVKINETLYLFLIQEQEKSRLLKVKETTENIMVVYPALVPLKPKGLITNLLMSMIAAFLFSLTLAFYLESNKKIVK